MAPIYLPAIATQSVGRAPHHALPKRLRGIAASGFVAVEIFWEDLSHYASTLTTPPTNTPTDAQILLAATNISTLCRSLNLAVLCLQPFMHYEGLLSSTSHQQRITDLHFWIRLAHILHTDLIQIPSSFLSPTLTTGSHTHIISDLRQAADIGAAATPPIRFAYEALAWGTHVDTWEDAYSLVCQADRPNLGICLDTFNICGRVYADPTSSTGLNENAHADMAASLARLRSIDMSKVFYVEACDGARLSEPLVEGHKWWNSEQKERMSWSRQARLWPCEEEEFGGYLPVEEVLRTVCERGYQGYVAFEVFNERGYDGDEEVVGELCKRSERSWRSLEQRMEWNGAGAVVAGVDEVVVVVEGEGRTSMVVRDRKDSGVGSETEAEAEAVTGARKIDAKLAVLKPLSKRWQVWDEVQGMCIAPRI